MKACLRKTLSVVSLSAHFYEGFTQRAVVALDESTERSSISYQRMEVSGLDETLKVLSSSLSHIKWRFRSSTKRRLETDVLALCTGMRPVVMVDYGGKMPELQERLCALLQTCQKESPVFEHLRIMVIEDMIYLVHGNGLAEYVRSTLNLEVGLHLVDLESDPPKMITPAENSLLGVELISVQKQFCSSFPLNEMNKDLELSCTDSVADAKPLINECNTSQSSRVIDLSSCMQETQVTIPTLNGWLLGYPLVYLFGKEHIADAIYNLSTKSLRIYKILIRRNVSPDKASQQDELMSFSVPYDLSMGGSDEPWAKAFLSHMQAKWEKCKPFWKSLEMEVSECYPQAIAL